MKKFLIASALALATASSAMATKTPYSGVYMGGNFGYAFGNGKMKNDPFRGTTASDKTDLSISGLRGGLHLGWGHLFQNNLYLGFEGSGDYSNTDGQMKSADTSTESYNAKRKDAFGIALRAGGVLGGMLGYVKLGIETAKWDFNTNQEAALGTGKRKASSSERLVGFPIGLGFETMVTDHIMVGTEYTLTTYRPSSTLETRNVANDGYNTKFTPRVSDFRLRLSYKW